MNTQEDGNYCHIEREVGESDGCLVISHFLLHAEAILWSLSFCIHLRVVLQFSASLFLS